VKFDRFYGKLILHNMFLVRFRKRILFHFQMQHLNTEIQTAHSVIYYLYLYIVIPNTWFLSNEL